MANILVVEGPGAFRDALVSSLGRRGHAAGVADDAATAAAVLIVEPADLVVADDAAAADLAALAADPRGAWLAGTPVVLVTARPSPATPPGLDVRAVLVRSQFSLSELPATVEQALGRAG